MSWISIDSKALELDAIQDSRRAPSGAETHWKPSAYDLPEAFQVEFSPEQNKLAIRLRYIANESDLEMAPLEDAPANLFQGKCSGRIYAIEITLPDLNSPTAVTEALDKVVSSLKRFGNRQRGGSERAAILRARVAERVVSNAPRLAGEANLRQSSNALHRWLGASLHTPPPSPAG